MKKVKERRFYCQVMLWNILWKKKQKGQNLVMKKVKERRLMCMSKTAAPVLSSHISLPWDPCQKYGSHLVSYGSCTQYGLPLVWLLHLVWFALSMVGT